MHTIFITGATGYIGSRIIEPLKAQGFHIKALIRKGSKKKFPPGCEIVFGDALDADTYKDEVHPSETFIHLVGVSHPSPRKKELFRKIDLVSIREAVKAAQFAGIKHFIYLSVSQYPSGIMKDFQEVRAEGENLLMQSGMNASFIRPWYVLGQGHWWPLLLKPLYFLLKRFPATRDAAQNLDTVTIGQMVRTIVSAVNHVPDGIRKYEVQEMKGIR
jgi:uncharacterized protein YbjT (DUF2867 family)